MLETFEHETKAPSFPGDRVDVEGIVRPGVELWTTQEPVVIVDRGRRHWEQTLVLVLYVGHRDQKGGNTITVLKKSRRLNAPSF